VLTDGLYMYTTALRMRRAVVYAYKVFVYMRRAVVYAYKVFVYAYKVVVYAYKVVVYAYKVVLYAYTLSALRCLRVGACGCGLCPGHDRSLTCCVDHLVIALEESVQRLCRGCNVKTLSRVASS
jgi:hypothetical protein